MQHHNGPRVHPHPGPAMVAPASPWKPAASVGSLLELNWKNALRWLVVGLLLLFGLGCISAGMGHFSEYRKLRLACEAGQVSLPTYDQAVAQQSLSNEPPMTCLRKDSSTHSVRLDCSCYAGLSWTSGWAFTSIGVLLLLCIMLALTDHCCCCFRPEQTHRNVGMNAPAAVVVGIPADMATMGAAGYPAYGHMQGMGPINMRALHPQHAGMQMGPYSSTHYTVHDHEQDLMLSIPISIHASTHSDLHTVMGRPASPPPTKSTLPYRTIQ